MKEVLQVLNPEIKSFPHDKEEISQPVNSRQLIIGLCALIVGVLFYCFFRPAEQTYFLKFLNYNIPEKRFIPSEFVVFWSCVPTFIHVFAFTLITASISAREKSGYATVCLLWFLIDIIFEFGQGFSSNIIPVIPDWFSKIIFLENTKNYFLYGRFDSLDVLSISLGSIAAYILLIKTRPNREGQK